MKLNRRKLIAVALAVLLAAIGWALFEPLRGPRVEPLVTSSGRRLGGFCAAASTALCEARLRCGQLEPLQRDACLDQAGAECERSVGWKLAAGVLAVDGEAQDECLEGMASAGCNALLALQGDDEADLFELTDKCELGELFQPRSGLGDACAESADCTAGFCPGLALQCHRCSAFAAVGQQCKAGEVECDPAVALCAASSSDGAGLCVRLGDDGAPCSGGHQCRSRACTNGVCGGAAVGALCASSADCAGGRFCKLEPGRGTCHDRAKTGEACAAQEGACAEAEAHCVAGKCRVRPFLLGAGASCLHFTDCKEGLFCQGGRGGAEGRCAPQARAGEPCDHLDYGTCRADARCLDGKCRRLRGPGEACASPFQCKAFLSCLPRSLEAGFRGGATCVPSPRVGEPCNPHLGCVASFCDSTSGKCRALAGGGAHCVSSEECASGWCAGPAASAACYAPCTEKMRPDKT